MTAAVDAQSIATIAFAVLARRDGVNFGALPMVHPMSLTFFMACLAVASVSVVAGDRDGEQLVFDDRRPAFWPGFLILAALAVASAIVGIANPEALAVPYG